MSHTTPPAASRELVEKPERVLRRPLLITLALIWPAQLLAVVGSLSGNAQPQIAQHFHTTNIEWFTQTFVLVSIAAVPFAMRCGEIFGKRRVMLILATAGITGDAITVLAPNYPIMLVGRSIAGLYGPVVALVMASVRDLFPPKRVAAAYGTITGSIGVAHILSPLLAGQLLDRYGWQSALWALTISTALAAACVALVPETPRTATTAKFDWLGGLLLGGGVGVIVWGVGKGDAWGWSDLRTLGCIGGGLLALVLFILVELRAEHPVVNVRMFKRRSVAAVLAGPSLVQGVFFVSPVVLTFLALYPAIPHASDGLGWTMTHTAVVGIPAGVITTAAGVAAGLLLRRVGVRALWFSSAAVLATGFVLAGLFHGSAGEIIGTGTLIGVGGGMMVAAVGSMIVSVVTAEEQAAANGLGALLYQATGVITYQILFVVLDRHSTVMRGTAFYLDEGYRNAYFVLAVLVGIGMLLALAMPRIERPDQALSG
ncbi:MFS transporter [Streptomyces yaanensis]|uniref:MFS transporter n=1 Tax=Streptomyces yaanensis TaxID=1142239 RepID=A0ABV7SKL6_9ACTN|nr:MFS transporter [Streptomyces sp. CGMCC 4.7035]WNC00403.1 MFS transporter [Streptomyces sp. CGMCC 4.7035]